MSTKSRSDHRRLQSGAYLDTLVQARQIDLEPALKQPRAARLILGQVCQQVVLTGFRYAFVPHFDERACTQIIAHLQTGCQCFTEASTCCAGQLVRRQNCALSWIRQLPESSSPSTAGDPIRVPKSTKNPSVAMRWPVIMHDENLQGKVLCAAY